MKEYTTNLIRNVALAGHLSAGKTMLTEAFLHFTGATTRLGRIEDGTTVSDFDEEEIRRKISLYSSVIPVEYKDHKINFLDTPGYADFVGEVISALRVSDAAIMLVDSVAGLEVGTEIAWQHCNTFKLPRFVVINKMERENANFQKALASVQEFSDIRLIPIQLPWGEKAEFKGVIDLLTMKAYKGDGRTAVEIPAEFQSAAEEARMALVEAAAEADEELTMKFLEGEEFTKEEIKTALRSLTIEGRLIPVICGSSYKNKGVQMLLDAVIAYMPSPIDIPAIKGVNPDNDQIEERPADDNGPFSALAFKIKNRDYRSIS